MAASASVEGLIVLWDTTQNKEKKGLVMLAQMQVPIQQIKKRGAELGAIQLQYNSALNELVTLGTDKRLTFWSVEKRKMIT